MWWDISLTFHEGAKTEHHAGITWKSGQREQKASVRRAGVCAWRAMKDMQTLFPLEVWFKKSKKRYLVEEIALLWPPHCQTAHNPQRWIFKKKKLLNAALLWGQRVIIHPHPPTYCGAELEQLCATAAVLRYSASGVRERASSNITFRMFSYIKNR